MHYNLVNCPFGILILKEDNWDQLKIDSFAINNAPFTTTNQPFGNPRTPFEISYYALQSSELSFWYLDFERRLSFSSLLRASTDKTRDLVIQVESWNQIVTLRTFGIYE